MFHEYYSNATCSTHFLFLVFDDAQNPVSWHNFCIDLATPVGHRVGEVAHDYVPALRQWLATKGIRNSYDSWHGRSPTKFYF